MKKIIARSAAYSAEGLIAAISEMVDEAAVASKAAGNSVRGLAERVYVTINSDSLRVVLVEETLTDGSKVYNIELKEASK